MLPRSLLIAGAIIASNLVSTTSLAAPASSTVLAIDTDNAGPIVNRDIFGQFVEMLGDGVYDGIWVGKDSRIPNVRGIRSDVVSALRELHVPVVRWPGGCFGDRYNWRDGIGASRTSTVNNWGNVVEPNTFGTDEYMDFIDQIGAEAYVSINVGSGTPQSAANWLEYMTTDQPSALGNLRSINGHPDPYRIKYLGIGNESWGCGGGMSAENYVAEYKRFATFAINLNPAQNGPIMFIRSKDAMQNVAAGPDGNKTEYTEAVMKAWSQRPDYGWTMDGLSLHYYTGGTKGVLASPSSGFGEAEYAASLKNTWVMDDLIQTHASIMDRYDPTKKVGLMIDEWGLWASPMPGSKFMFMKQNGTLRDAIVAALNLNIFARHADRVRMANIAQMANVIHAMVLTDGPKMLRTPSYHVFRLYVPFQGAQLLPVKVDAGQYTFGSVALPRVDAIAARARDGKVWLAVTNLDASRVTDISLAIAGLAARSATGEVLTGPQVDSLNSFDQPNSIIPQAVRVAAKGGSLVLHLPPKSVTVVQVE